MIHCFREKFFKIKFFRYHTKFLKRESSTLQIFFSRINYIARIKIDRPEIAGILNIFIEYSADTGNDKFASPHCVEKELMVDDVIPFLRGHIEFISLSPAEVLHKSMRRSDRRARIFTYKMIRPAVKNRTIEFSHKIGLFNAEIYFVENIPKINVRGNPRNNVFEIRFKIFIIVLLLPIAFFFKPKRDRKMDKR